MAAARFRDVQRILVQSTSWVGDAVMSLPALEALRARFPRAEIVMLSKPWVSEVYWHLPAVNRQIIFKPASEHRGSTGLIKLIRELRAERFDAAVLLPNAFQAALDRVVGAHSPPYWVRPRRPQPPAQ